jgi:Amt family ammonium transporter
MAGVGIAVVLSGSATLVIMIGLKYTLGIRLSDEDEAEGLDLSQHGEEAYNDRD